MYGSQVKKDNTYTKINPKKYLDQYSEDTLTVVWKITYFATKVLLHEITAAYISLSEFKNLFILFGLTILVMIKSAQNTQKILIKNLENLEIPNYTFSFNSKYNWIRLLYEENPLQPLWIGYTLSCIHTYCLLENPHNCHF